MLQRYLEAQGFSVCFTEWNSADLVKATAKKGKKKRTLTPTTFSLLHATDFAHRLLSNMLPPLKAGMIVLADRYVFTAFARDVVRGCDRSWVRKVYSFAPKPDVSFFFRVPVDTALQRITMARPQLKDFEAGLDLNLHPDAYESFRVFQGGIQREYEKMVDEYDLVVMDGSHSIADEQRRVRQVIDERLVGYHRNMRIA